jgi:hypothetical protein
MPSPAFGFDSFAWLNGVSCRNAADCYAVGSLNDGTLIEHWNGVRWSVMSTPSPAAPFIAELSAVSCGSASNCFAVGTAIAFTETDFRLQTLIEHWNGSQWSIVASPNPTGSIFSSLSGISCPTATSCVAVGASEFGNLVEHWNGSRWKIAPTPNGSTSLDGFGFDALSGVSCVTATYCYAVGATEDRPIIERWNGARWGIVTTLRPANTVFAELNDISCPSKRHCVAVGMYSTDPEGETSHQLIERWNGTNWALVPSPDLPTLFGFVGLTGVSCAIAADCSAVGGSPYVDHWNGQSWAQAPFATISSQSQLRQVACLSIANCFAVGTYFTGTRSKTLVERWNGSSWSIVPSPNPNGSLDAALNGISCPGLNTCYAVGSSLNATGSKTLVERWNGTSWSIVATPTPIGALDAELGAVSCSSTTSCMAVGSYATFSDDKPFAQRWNGTSWSNVAIPTPSAALFTIVTGVSCTSPTSCRAVGGYFAGSGLAVRPLAESWNGATWSIVATPNPSSDFAAFNGLTCTSATDCTAVGFKESSSSFTGQTLVEHWNGTSWAIVASPNPSGATDAGLNGVSCPSAGNCYAVGSYSTATSTKTLVEHWDGSTWAIQASPNPTNSAAAALFGVSCPGPASCFAVGAYAANAGLFTLTERST